VEVRSLTVFGERFLREPSLFPRRISGEIWGEENLTVTLARDRYRIEGMSHAQAQSVRERYGARVSDAPGDVTVRVFRAPQSDFRDIDTRGWEYALDLAWSDDDAFTIAGMKLMARAELATMRAGVWTSIDDVEGFWGVLENVLRPLLAARLLANGGLLVHSAAVCGWLLPSASGGGKSTIARMAVNAGLPVLSDDLNAIVRDGATLVLEPLPFTGDLLEHEVSTTAEPLEAIVAIEKGDRDAARDLAMSSAVSLLVRCAPYVNQDAHRMPQLLERASEIAAAAARAVLTFRRDGDVWLYCMDAHGRTNLKTDAGLAHPLPPLRGRGHPHQSEDGRGAGDQ
jgi:hypothetical protein